MIVYNFKANSSDVFWLFHKASSYICKEQNQLTEWPGKLHPLPIQSW